MSCYICGSNGRANIHISLEDHVSLCCRCIPLSAIFDYDSCIYCGNKPKIFKLVIQDNNVYPTCAGDCEKIKIEL